MPRPAFILTLFIFTASFSAENLNEALYAFQHSSGDKIARQVTSLSSSKPTNKQLLKMLDLLDNKSSLKKVGNQSEVRDLAVIIFHTLSHIQPSKRDLEVKAIISFKNNAGKIYRYHLVKLSENEFSIFKTKVQNWLFKKIPA